MVRAVLWLLALFGIAVGSALFAAGNPGTVTLFWPPYRVDLSLNLVLLALLAWAAPALWAPALAALLVATADTAPAAAAVRLPFAPAGRS